MMHSIYMNFIHIYIYTYKNIYNYMLYSHILYPTSYIKVLKLIHYVIISVSKLA